MLSRVFIFATKSLVVLLQTVRGNRSQALHAGWQKMTLFCGNHRRDANPNAAGFDI
jgi:hypothetical protein